MTTARLGVLLGLSWVFAIQPAPAAGHVIDIRDCAVGDGKTLSTAAIQEAVDRCAAKGRNRPSSAGHVADRHRLPGEQSDARGSMKGDAPGHPGPPALPDAASAGFRYAAILAGANLENLTIRGSGIIDGQAAPFETSRGCGPRTSTSMTAGTS